MNFLDQIFQNPGVVKAIPEAFVQTLLMVGISGVATTVLGLPLGIILYLTASDGLKPLPIFNRILSDIIVNITRSIPFAILMVALIPFARIITGTSIGPLASTVSLTIGTVPFFARLVEVALREIDAGKIEAAKVMGSTTLQIVRKVLVPEALPSLISALTTTIITLIGYSAMAGVIGGGGLGFLAYTYGLQRFDPVVMILTIIIIVILVQIVQLLGDWLARRVDHRSSRSRSSQAKKRKPVTAS